MPSSRHIIHQDEETQKILKYEPQEFGREMEVPAKEFVKEGSVSQESGSFRISELISQITGIAKVKSDKLEREIEERLVEKMKVVQEEAYEKAYNLGKEEGFAKAYEDTKNDITESLETFTSLVDQFNSYSKNIFDKNETNFVDMIYFLTEKIVMKEVEKDKESIIPVLKECMQSIQNDEQIILKVSSNDKSIVENFIEKSGEKNNFPEKIKILIDDSIESGGCLVETNYGEINASIKARLEKSWSILTDKKPHIEKDED